MIGDVAPGGPIGTDPAAIEGAREEFLRRMLAAVERGVLDATEYAARVQALEAASSVADMAAIVARPVPGAPIAPPPGAVVAPASPPAGPAVGAGPAATDGPNGSTGPALDPVDLARLMAPSSGRKRRNERSRYAALIAVVVLFAVLVVAGLWLASHVHAAGGAVGPSTLLGAVAFAVP